MDKIMDVLENEIIFDLEDIITLSNKETSLLHTFVLLTNKYPKLYTVIKNYIILYPEEVNKINDNGLTALHLASTNNSSTETTLKILKLLLKHNADVNAEDETGWTALMNMAYCSNKRWNIIPSPKVLKLLLENGAGIYSKNNYNWDSLSYMTRHPSKELCTKTVKLLLEYEAIPNEYFYNFEDNIRQLNVKN